ncbi:MAG: ImmA/IrrE family metallo-endopeptidase [Burkholderiaceae bacterium]|nr:ImmA/IrrE family metallo-endopeptidase [Burkholderiaceae bacterium]
MNQNTAEFSPNWISSPGATLVDILNQRKLKVADFAVRINRSSSDVAQLLAGVTRLTPDWAENLVDAVGASKDFWLRREELYRFDIARLSSEAGRDAMKGWLSELPIKDLARNQWIDARGTVEEVAQNVLAFFGVPTIAVWRQVYGNTLNAAAYRTSSAYEVRPGAEATWLRQGEIQAQALDCEPWSREVLLSVLPKIRELTRQADPQVFLPELTSILATAGVAVVVAKPPEGCRASGATKFVTDDKALMLLSFRYLRDDEFWFTVFHEIGHLALHLHDEIFLEGSCSQNPLAEGEANAFALEHLFINSGFDVLRTLALNKFSIARFARRLGIAPGIVVGQLQDIGRIPYKHFNFLKVRYAWSN